MPLSDYVPKLPLSLARGIRGRLRTPPLQKEDGARAGSCLLVMNGPSLTESKSWLQKRRTDAVIAVNHFADSEYFEQIQPEIYVIQDTYFWQSDAMQTYREKREATFLALNEKTDWPLEILFPNRCNRESWIFDQFANPHITIRFWNANFIQRRSGEGGLLASSQMLFTLWRSEWAAPPPDNVLVAALYIAERLGFVDLTVIGADFSFFREMRVDQASNRVGREVEHFYGSEFRPISKGKTGENPTTMAHEMLRWHRAFRSLEVMADYLGWCGVSVTNRSAYSYIDCFSRG